MAANGEKNAINGRVIPMEDYGSIKPSAEDERVNILEEDELVSNCQMAMSGELSSNMFVSFVCFNVSATVAIVVLIAL